MPRKAAASKVVELPAAAVPVAAPPPPLEPPARIRENEHALYAWRVMSEHLVKRKVASGSFVLALEMAAGAYAQARAAEAKMLANPADCHYPVHYHRASKLFLDYCRQFGLTWAASQETDSRQLRLSWDRQSSEVLGG